jgi:serine/threonine protein kinase
MFDKDGKLILIDFGLAVDINRDYSNDTKRANGTEGYIPPETFLAFKDDFTRDVWAAGIIFFGFLFRFIPFSFEELEIEQKYSNKFIHTKSKKDLKYGKVRALEIFNYLGVPEYINNPEHQVIESFKKAIMQIKSKKVLGIEYCLKEICNVQALDLLLSMIDICP